MIEKEGNEEKRNMFDNHANNQDVVRDVIRALDLDGEFWIAEDYTVPSLEECQ